MSNLVVVGKVKTWLTERRAEIMRGMPNHGEMFERSFQLVIADLQSNTKLMACSPESLFQSIRNAFILGFIPVTGMNDCYLIPYKGIAKLQISYQGMITLARRSGFITSIYADFICEKDEYKIMRGTENKLTHEIKIGDRGNAIAYYAVAKDKNVGFDFEVMSIPEINKVRDEKCKAQDISATPWGTDFPEMAKKTVLKRLLKRIPKTIDDNNIRQMIAIEEDNKNAVADYSKDDKGLTDIFIDAEIVEKDSKPKKSKFEQKAETVPNKENKDDYHTQIADIISANSAPVSVGQVINYLIAENKISSEQDLNKVVIDELKESFLSIINKILDKSDLF